MKQRGIIESIQNQGEKGKKQKNSHTKQNLYLFLPSIFLKMIFLEMATSF